MEQTTDMRTTAQRELDAEAALVEQQLADATNELFSPFSQMIGTMLRGSRPLMRAGMVLAAGFTTPDTETLRSQRIYLASALEMLHLAVNVHMTLERGAGNGASPSLLGSTVLAGDYCFSRSAAYAVRTGDSVVVEIFSEALKRVSEGHLRSFFDSSAVRYNEDRDLFIAGTAAAMQLVGATERTRTTSIQLAELFASATTADELLSSIRPLLSGFSSEQQERWLALCEWRGQRRP